MNLNKEFMKKSLIILALICFAYFANAQWQQTNGPYGVQIYSIVTSGNTIFAGTSSGLYKSSNNGSSWTLITNGVLENNSFRSLTISGDSIYAGTSNGNIFLSTDNGSSWISIYLSQYNQIYSLVKKGNSIFAGTDAG